MYPKQWWSKWCDCEKHVFPKYLLTTRHPILSLSLSLNVTSLHDQIYHLLHQQTQLFLPNNSWFMVIKSAMLFFEHKKGGNHITTTNLLSQCNTTTTLLMFRAWSCYETAVCIWWYVEWTAENLKKHEDWTHPKFCKLQQPWMWPANVLLQLSQHKACHFIFHSILLLVPFRSIRRWRRKMWKYFV